MANGFVEVSGYSATDLANARTAGYNECKEDLTTLTAEENGTYIAEDEGVVGWDRVEVEAQADLFHRVITANGDYDAEEDGHQGYSSVTVAVPGGGGGGPFTVRFFDDDRQTILKTDSNVPYGGSASCTLLDGTTLNDQYFKGWNPSPTNVKEDMNCYPVYGDYIIDPNEIADSWETICEVKGAGYPLGSYKALVFDVPAWDYGRYDYKVWHGGEWVDDYTDLSNPVVSVAIHMVKVAEGEDGSTSSWISTGGIYLDGVMRFSGGGNDTSGFGRSSNTHSDWKAVPDWGSSFVRKYLNEQFLSNMPQCIKDTIKEVNKSYLGMTHSVYYDRQTTQTLVEKTSIDKIWIPSRKELQTRCQGMGHDSFCESNGIDYSLIYYHTLNAGCTFRTSMPYNDNTYYIIQQECLGTNNLVSGACNKYVMFGFCL